MNVTMTGTAIYRRPDAARAADLQARGMLDPATSCTGKVRYPSQNDARHAAKIVQRTEDRRFGTYHCAYCHEYHITKFKHGEGEE